MIYLIAFYADPILIVLAIVCGFLMWLNNYGESKVLTTLFQIVVLIGLVVVIIGYLGGTAAHKHYALEEFYEETQSTLGYSQSEIHILDEDTCTSSNYYGRCSEWLFEAEADDRLICWNSGKPEQPPRLCDGRQ